MLPNPSAATNLLSSRDQILLEGAAESSRLPELPSSEKHPMKPDGGGA